MDHKIISENLAVALVTLPRITMANFYSRCSGLVGKMSLPQFKIEVTKWLTNGTIPGYEMRKGPTGGIYRKNSPTEHFTKNKSVTEEIDLDPTFIAEFVENILKTQSHITVKSLATMIDYSPITETQFKAQMSKWLNDGKTFPLFVSHRGPTGGIYLKGVEPDKFNPHTVSENSNDEEDSEEGMFTLQISPTLRIAQNDDRNWTIQKKSGDVWINKCYHSDLPGVLNSAVRHIVNGEFKLSNSTSFQLKDISSMIRQMEGRITTQLKLAIEQSKSTHT